MVITTCGHCGARFRVTPQQLNARQGQVRCGRCHGVFSGFESLERHAEDGVVTIAAPAPAPRADPLEALEPLPIEELTGIEPPAAQAAVAPEPKAQPREARRSRESVNIPADPARGPPARRGDGVPAGSRAAAGKGDRLRPVGFLSVGGEPSPLYSLPWRSS